MNHLFTFGLAAAEQTPTSLWAALVAVIMALISIFGPVVRDAVKPKATDGATGKTAAGGDALTAVLTELTRAMTENAQAYGRLADVLDRMEADSAKSADELRRRLEELSKLLERMDYRTREIRDDVKELIKARTNGGD